MADAAGTVPEPLHILEEGRLEPGIQWLLGRATAALEQADFLLPEELAEGQRYRHPGRHRQWLLGRAAAKWLLLEREGQVWRAEAARRYCLQRQAQGWPEIFRAEGGALALPLSLSHCGDFVLAALGLENGPALGVDLEVIEPRSPSFVEDFFTAGERKQLTGFPAADVDRAVTAIWCLKEALLKALKTGLRRRTSDIDVRSLGEPAADGWRRATVHLSPEGRHPAWWRVSLDGRLVLALGLLQGG